MWNRISDYMGDSHPGQEPEVEAHRDIPVDYTRAPGRVNEVFQWVATPKGVIIHPDKSHQELWESLSLIPDKLPHAQGTMEVHYNHEVLWHLESGSMAVGALEKVLKKDTKDRGWKYDGIVNQDGRELAGTKKEASDKPYWADNTEPENLIQYAELVPIRDLMYFREYDREPGGEHNVQSQKYWDTLVSHISQNGILSPLYLNYHPDSHTAKLSEGNHRLKAAEQAGLTHVPVLGYRTSYPQKFKVPYSQGTPPDTDVWGNPRWGQYIRPSDMGFDVQNVNPHIASVVGVDPNQKEAVGQHSSLLDSLIFTILDVKFHGPDGHQTPIMKRVEVYENDKMIADMALTKEAEGLWRITHVGVDEPYRRKGVATAMYEYAESELESTIVHSPEDQTDEGRAWAQHIGSVVGVDPDNMPEGMWRTTDGDESWGQDVKQVDYYGISDAQDYGVCPECDMPFKSFTAWKRHMQDDHENQPSTDDNSDEIFPANQVQTFPERMWPIQGKVGMALNPEAYARYPKRADRDEVDALLNYEWLDNQVYMPNRPEYSVNKVFGIPPDAIFELQTIPLNKLRFRGMSDISHSGEYWDQWSEDNGLDPNHYQALQKDIGEAGDIPPLVVVSNGSEYLLEDGQHRATIARHLGLTEFPAYVYSPYKDLSGVKQGSRYPKTKKCKYCKEPATQRVVWAEGMAYVPACDKHIEKAKSAIDDPTDIDRVEEWS